MRRLNVKLLLYVTLAGLLLAVAVVVVHELQAGNISSALLWQATQAEKQGRLKQAARYLRRYLEFAKNDMDERAHLGRLLADPKIAITPRARERARFVIEAVLTKDPSRHELREALVRMALVGWDLDVAKEQLQRLQKARPDDGEVLGLTAHLLEKQGKTGQAVEVYRKALAKAPERPEHRVHLIGLLLERERKTPGSQEAEIKALVAAALKQAPTDTGVLIAASEWALYKGDPAGARKHLDAGLAAHADEPRLYQALAGLEIRAGRREEAIKALRHGLDATPVEGRYELLWMLANVHADGGEVAEARKATARIRDDVGPSPMVDYLEARCLLAQQRWPEAATAFERNRDAFKGSPELALQVNLFLGKCYEQMNEPGQQLAAYTRALAQDPASVAAREGVASAQWALGQTNAAVEQYREVVKLRGDRREGGSGRLELARMLLLSNRQRDVKRWRQVEEELDAAEKEEPGSAEAALLRAELRLAQGQPAQAEQVLKEAQRRRPRSIDLWRARVALAQRRGDDAAAQQVLDDAERLLGDVADVRVARAHYWAGKPRAEAGPALDRLEQGADKFSAEDSARLLHALAEAQFQTGDIPHAVRLWEQLAARPHFADDLRLRLLLFDVALRQGDDAAMRRLLSEVKRLDAGDGTTWRYVEAARLMWLGRRGQKKALDQAQPLLDAVVSVRPTWAPALISRADLEELRGRPDAAIARYRQALERGVRDPRVVRQMVQLLSAQQRYGEAEQVLRQLGQQAPLSGELQRMAVALSLQNDDFARAEELVRQSTPAGSGDFRDQIWLGQVLAAGNRTSAEAEKAFRRAVELADTVPVTWVALVGYLADAGKVDQARAAIEKARGKLPAADVPLALAQCHELVGDSDKARAQYEAALQARPGDVAVRRSLAVFYLRTGAWKQAEPHLREIMAGKLGATEDDATWARRTLALALLGGGEAGRLAEALSLVGLRLDAQGNVAEALASGAGSGRAEDIARARVLASQNRRPFQARAIALLEQAGKEQALVADDLFLLTRLYLSYGAGDAWWGKAREQLRALVTANGRNSSYLGFYARSLLQHGATAEAGQVIDRLEQLEKSRQVPAGAFGSVELRAEALEAAGRGRQALTLLNSWARRPGAPPERLLQGAALQGRLGDLSQAFDTCQEAGKSCPPEAVAAAGIAILRASQPGGKGGAPADVWRAQAGRVEGWLNEGIKAQPARAVLRLQLADMMDLVGRGGEAEALYRQVLQQDDKNPVALNNLAWLLSRQDGKQQESLQLINRAIELYGPQADLLDTRALVYLALGQGPPAVADLRRAVADAPSPSTYFHLVRAHQLTRDTRSALAVLNQASAAGLTVDQLHPTERDTYRRVVAELKNR
jgi:tetratricopeptide (TPR) repeat protein